jgi:pheromone shutdown protein TraB
VSLSAVTTKLTASSNSTASTAVWAASVTALVPTIPLAAYRTAGYVIAELCKPVLKRLHFRTLENKLDDSDKDELENSKFTGLWWANYLRHG